MFENDFSSTLNPKIHKNTLGDLTKAVMQFCQVVLSDCVSADEGTFAVLRSVSTDEAELNDDLSNLLGVVGSLRRERKSILRSADQTPFVGKEMTVGKWKTVVLFKSFTAVVFACSPLRFWS